MSAYAVLAIIVLTFAPALTYYLGYKQGRSDLNYEWGKDA